MEGAKLGRSRLFDSKSLRRVPDVKVVPNEEDAALLLDNVRGVKGTVTTGPVRRIWCPSWPRWMIISHGRWSGT